MTLALGATGIIKVTTVEGHELEWAIPLALTQDIVNRLNA